MDPKAILEQTRAFIAEHAAGDPDKWWYANRFIFARLQLDERKTKTDIKKRLLDAGQPCHGCGQPFQSRTGVHLHRLDGDRGYSDGNCVLMHATCHQKLHAEAPAEASGEDEQGSPGGERGMVLTKWSKSYEDMPFTYWWDIAPNSAEKLDRYEAVVFACKDTGLRCTVPVPELKAFLLPERQTTRGDGHWGVKVLLDREDDLAFEPGTGKGREWLFLPVAWADEQ